MTAPRPVFPGQFVFLTRRCTQRQFLLRPDDETNNAFVYCLAEAAAYTEVEVVLSQMMSNHHHTMIYDPHGNIVAFKQRFHQLLSKCQNALRGRWDGVWSGDEPSTVDVVERADLVDKLVYIATNPVKDGLVETCQRWPGPKLVQVVPPRYAPPRHPPHALLPRQRSDAGGGRARPPPPRTPAVSRRAARRGRTTDRRRRGQACGDHPLHRTRRARTRPHQTPVLA